MRQALPREKRRLKARGIRILTLCSRAEALQVARDAELVAQHQNDAAEEDALQKPTWDDKDPTLDPQPGSSLGILQGKPKDQMPTRSSRRYPIFCSVVYLPCNPSHPPQPPKQKRRTYLKKTDTHTDDNGFVHSFPTLAFQCQPKPRCVQQPPLWKRRFCG